MTASRSWPSAICQSVPKTPAQMLGLGLKIGEQINSAHVATLVFAHWPGRTCQSFDDLLRISSYGPLLGNFVRIQDYFTAIYDPGYGDTFTIDEYKSPYLQQAINSKQSNPISRFLDYWTVHQRTANCRALLAYAVSLASVQSAPGDSKQLADAVEVQLGEIEIRLDEIVDTADAVTAQSLFERVQSIEQQLAESIKRLVDQVSQNQPHACRVVINPTITSRRSSLSFAALAPAVKQAQPLLLQDSGSNQTDCVVEIAGAGHVCFAATATRKDPFRGDPTVLHENLLRNEFFEVHVDERTGGIRSVQLYDGRKNLLGQKLALRIPGQPKSGNSPLTPARYSEMVVDSVETLATSRIRGQLTTRGRLLDGDQLLANYQQTIVVTRGLRTFDLEIELEPVVELSDSINHYFCNRLAWKDESATLFANAQESKHPITSDWFLGTQFIEIQQSDGSATLLTGGLPYHRRVSRRMLDSVLMIGRESRRSFRLALGVGVRYPMMASCQWMTPLIEFESQVDPKKLPNGWLYHFDCKNILATWWQPLWDQESRLKGLQIRLKETEGRGGKMTIRCPRNLESAARTNFDGESIRPLEIDDAKDRVAVDFAGFEYFQISLIWVP